MTVTTLPKTMRCGTSERRIRIALVYSRLPFPMMRGDQITVAHLIGFLTARGHQIDLYDIAVDGKLTADQDKWLRSSCNRVNYYRQGLFAKGVGLLRAGASGNPLQIGLFHNRKLARDLETAVENRLHDIVYCYYPRTALAVPDLRQRAGGPISVLALQLSQTLNTQRMANNETSRLKRLVFQFEARRMGRFESGIWQRFHRVVLIGPADVAAVQEQCIAHGQQAIDNWVYGAHGTDTEKFVAATPEELVAHRVVFSGSMLYPPNVQAVLWFVKEAWPLIRRSVPEATFIVQGRDPVPRVKQLDGKEGVQVTGTVSDVGVLIRSAAVCVNPMLAAGGMQNKLIEYLASGKAVVASSIANEGIRAPHNAVVVADDPKDFAAAVVRLLVDQAEAAALGLRAREYVLANWTWEKHFLDLEQVFFDALDANGDAPDADRHVRSSGAGGSV